MSRLRDGETVRPDGFKRVIDERSPLFVGFDQQDSHEFLTTLLDLIDTDYTKKADEEQQDESMETASVSSPLNESMETASDDADDETDTRDESSDKQSPLKRVRQDESYRDIVLPPYLKPRRSFSQLDVKGIDSLLHGDNFSSTQRDPFPFQPQQPRCKLIGGRMNTAKADLTAFVSDKMLEDGPPSPARMDRSIDESVASSAASDDDTDESSTPVTDFFNATVRVRLTCDSCKYSRTHKETFSFLSLEIGPDSGSVEDGLRRFFAPEKRELKCEKCFAESATQSMEIIHLPKLLLLHFKRFLVDVSHDYSSVSYRKNRSSVAFDDTLTLDDHGVLSEFLAADCRAQGTYQIKSVVNHIGSSASCGHYTCDSHRSRQQWFRFNDAFVSRIQPQQALEGSQRTAYMVLYELE
jgi:ubiquitin C-terminal hydrolase